MILKVIKTAQKMKFSSKDFFKDFFNNDYGAEISVIWVVERSAIKWLILIRY